MAYQQREGQGSLFKNEKQNDRQPDFKGSIMIKGVTYNISAWNRTSQNGRNYISLAAEERRDDGQQNYQPRQSYQQTPAYGQQPFYGQSGQTSRPAGPMPVDNFPAPTMEDMPAFAEDDPGEDLPF